MEGFTVRPGEKQLATMREVDSEISYRQDYLVPFIFTSKYFAEIATTIKPTVFALFRLAEMEFEYKVIINQPKNDVESSLDFF